MFMFMFMKRAREFAANNSMKEEEKRVAEIEGQRKADMDVSLFRLKLVS